MNLDQQPLTVEALAVAAACLLAWISPRIGNGVWAVFSNRVRQLSPLTSMLIIAAVPLLIRAALLPFVGIPSPVVMDEFSYLLGSDTFAHGRLANPATPVPEAFRALFILTTPAYASVYPPAQSAVLAIGQVFFGHPWWGVFLSIGVMAATSYWMARGFFSQPLAFAGGLLAGLTLGTFTYWMNSYWGGSVAAIGGNLVVGGYARLQRKIACGPAIAFIAGAIILGLRRPYEGLIISSIMGAFLVWDLSRRKPRPGARELMPLLAPLAAGLVLFTAFTAWYNVSLTGHWYTLAYDYGLKQASRYPNFVFQSLEADRPLPDSIQRVEQDYRQPRWEQLQSLSGFITVKTGQYAQSFPIYARVSSLLPLLFGVFAVWRTRRWKLFIAFLVVFISTLVAVPLHPHYLAPYLPLHTILLLAGFQAMLSWKPGKGLFGRALAGGLLMVFVLSALLAVGTVVEGKGLLSADPEFACCGLAFPHPRDAIEASILSRPGNNLVLVRYGPYHFAHFEYVYNMAELTSARIIWARDLGPDVTKRLMAVFPGRRLWRLDSGFYENGSPTLQELTKAELPATGERTGQ